jgi:hypothetical protein
MKFYRTIFVLLFLLGLTFKIDAQFNNAIILKVSSESSDNLRFSIWAETSNINLGQSITINYSIENKSAKNFYLVKGKEDRIRLFGENMLVEAPSALPTNHGDFDFNFVQIKPKKKILGRVIIPKEKIQSEGILPITLGFGYIENISGIDRKLNKGEDPFPLRSELEKRIKRLYVGDLGVNVK